MRSTSFRPIWTGFFFVDAKKMKKIWPRSDSRGLVRFSNPQTLTREAETLSTNLSTTRGNSNGSARQFAESRSPWGWEIENPWLQFARANTPHVAVTWLKAARIVVPSFCVSIALHISLNPEDVLRLRINQRCRKSRFNCCSNLLLVHPWFLKIIVII